MAIRLSDAYDIVSKKILICRMTIENLTHQKKESEAHIELHKVVVDASSKKIVLVQELSNLLEKQLNEFTEERNKECQLIYDELNDLDTNVPQEYKDAIEAIEFHREAMLTLMPKIDEIEKTIPTEKEITNYLIKRNLSNTANCNQEVLQ